MLWYHDHRRGTGVGRMSVGDGTWNGIIVCLVMGRRECTHKPAWNVDGWRGNNTRHHVIVTKPRGWRVRHRGQERADGR